MKRIAPWLVLMAGILWGMIGIFVRKLNMLGFESMNIVALRAIVTSVLLGLFLLIYDKRKLYIRWKDIWCFIGTGIFSVVFFNFCYFKAITLTSLSVAAILLYTAPAIVMVLSAVLFHEKITKNKIISLTLTFVGCVLVTGIVSGSAVLNVAGILVGLGAGLGYALYSIFSRYALERGYHSLTISFYTFLFAVIGTAPIADYGRIASVFRQDQTSALYCIAFGLISTVIPYITYTRGLREMENSKASIIASIEPVTATILGVLLYHEKLSISELVGVILVLGAIVINNNNENVEVLDGIEKRD